MSAPAYGDLLHSRWNPKPAHLHASVKRVLPDGYDGEGRDALVGAAMRYAVAGGVSPDSLFRARTTPLVPAEEWRAVHEAVHSRDGYLDGYVGREQAHFTRFELGVEDAIEWAGLTLSVVGTVSDARAAALSYLAKSLGLTRLDVVDVWLVNASSSLYGTTLAVGKLVAAGAVRAAFAEADPAGHLDSIGEWTSLSVGRSLCPSYVAALAVTGTTPAAVRDLLARGVTSGEDLLAVATGSLPLEWAVRHARSAS